MSAFEPTKEQQRAAVTIVCAMAETDGPMIEGLAYAGMMGSLSLDDFQFAVRALQHSGWIKPAGAAHVWCLTSLGLQFGKKLNAALAKRPEASR